MFPDLQKGYAQAQAQAAAAQAAREKERERERERFSQIPSRPSRGPNPPVPAAKDYLAEIGDMRATSLAMSRAVDMCIKALQQDVLGSNNASTLPSNPSERTMTALTALSHVRDVMSGKARTFDPSVLAPLNEALLPRAPATGSESNQSVEQLVDTSIPADAAPLARTPSANVLPSVSPNPLLYLSGRSDKPLPSLTRVPQPVQPTRGSAVPVGPPVPPSLPRPSAREPDSFDMHTIPSVLDSQQSALPVAQGTVRVPPKHSDVIDPLGVL